MPASAFSPARTLLTLALVAAVASAASVSSAVPKEPILEKPDAVATANRLVVTPGVFAEPAGGRVGTRPTELVYDEDLQRQMMGPPARRSVDQRLRRADPAFNLNGGVGLDSGMSWPKGTLASNIVGELKNYIYPGTAEYTALASIPTAAQVIFADTTAAGRLMTAGTAQRLLEFVSLLNTKLPSYGGNLHAMVLAGFLVGPTPIPTPAPHSLRYGARSLHITIRNGATGAILSSDTAQRVVADLLWEAGFDWLYRETGGTATTNYIVANTFDESCGADVDLAVLMDGSGSVKQAGWDAQKEFIKDLASQFVLGPDRTQIGVAVFEGPRASHFCLTLDCENNCKNGEIWEAKGLGCVCGPAVPCEGPSATPDSPGCSTSWFATVEGACDGDTSDPNFAATHPQCERRAFYGHDCPNCACDPDHENVELWTPTDSARVAFDLDDYTDLAGLQAHVDGLAYPDGATHLDYGLYVVGTSIFTPAAGDRDAALGVPEVIVVITDGKSNPNFEPCEVAADLHARGIRIFVISVGSPYEPELTCMASTPTDRHIFRITDPEALPSIVGRLGNVVCDAPDFIVPGLTVSTGLDSSRYKYYAVRCDVLTEKVIIKWTATNGLPGDVYVSSLTSTPSLVNNEAKDDSADLEKTLVFSRGSLTGPVYISVFNPSGSRMTYDLVVYQSAFVVDELTISVPESVLKEAPVEEEGPEMDFPTKSYVYTIDPAMNGGGFFTVDEVSGIIETTSLASFDYETGPNTYTVRRWATATDPDCLTGYQDVTINIINVNDNAPIFTATSVDVEINEEIKGPPGARRRRAAIDVSIGGVVTELTATDADEGDSVTFSFLGGNNGGGSFKLVPVTDGLPANTFKTQLVLEKALDFETTNSYTLTVVAEDAQGAVSAENAVVTVTVANVYEPPYLVDHPPVEIPEDESIGTLMADISVQGDDLADAPDYVCLQQGTTPDFVTVTKSAGSNTCRVNLASRPAKEGVYNLTVKIDDQKGNTDTSVLRITVLDVNEFAPSFPKGLYEVTVPSHQPAGSTVINLPVTDGDGEIPTCAFTSGNDNGFFAMDPDRCLISTTVRPLDFAGVLPDFQTLSVQATDGKFTAAVQVRVRFIDGCPVQPCDPDEITEAPERDYACKAGFTFCACLGGLSPPCSDQVDECTTLGQPCMNGATCENSDTSPSGVVCLGCPSWATGEFCDKVVDQCKSLPCKNGATCVREPMEPGGPLNSYRCLCEEGFFGTNCQNVDPSPNACASNPCVNGGTCVRASSQAGTNQPLDAFVCECVPGTAGVTCDETSGNCRDATGNDQCQNGGSCTPSALGGVCICTGDFYGELCTEEDTNPANDKCTPDPCQNGGTCVRTSSTGPGGINDDFQCVDCDANWVGKRCDLLVMTTTTGAPTTTTTVDPTATTIPPFTTTVDPLATTTTGPPTTTVNPALTTRPPPPGPCGSNPCENLGVCEAKDTNGDGVADSRICHCPVNTMGDSCEFTSEECLSDTGVDECLNGGVCRPSLTNGVCHCTANFFGDKCELTTSDPCAGAACPTGTTCTALRPGGPSSQPTTYQCGPCPPQTTGQRCEVTLDDGDLDPCASSPCQNDGACFTVANSLGDPVFECVCHSDTAGTQCELTNENCRGGKCQNGGLCQPSADGGICQCTGLFYGQFCTETSPDPCTGVVCPGGGSCKRVRNGLPDSPIDSYECEPCPPNFVGQDCDIFLPFGSSPCASNPCQNNGQCVETDLGLSTVGYECLCGEDFAGDNCELTNENCRDKCQNGGTCVPTEGGGACDCPGLFYGSLCQNTQTTDPCASVTCQNGGTCQPAVGALGAEKTSYFCSCPAGFVGQNCEVVLDSGDKDPCLRPFPGCQNGGVCVVDKITDDVLAPRCVCPPETSGAYCEGGSVSGGGSRNCGRLGLGVNGFCNCPVSNNLGTKVCPTGEDCTGTRLLCPSSTTRCNQVEDWDDIDFSLLFGPDGAGILELYQSQICGTNAAQTGGGSSAGIGLIVGIVAGVLVLAILLVLFLIYRKKQHDEKIYATGAGAMSMSDLQMKAVNGQTLGGPGSMAAMANGDALSNPMYGAGGFSEFANTQRGDYYEANGGGGAPMYDSVGSGSKETRGEYFAVYDKGGASAPEFSSASNPMYGFQQGSEQNGTYADTLHSNSSLSIERGRLRLASVSRNNPLMGGAAMYDSAGGAPGGAHYDSAAAGGAIGGVSNKLYAVPLEGEGNENYIGFAEGRGGGYHMAGAGDADGFYDSAAPHDDDHTYDSAAGGDDHLPGSVGGGAYDTAAAGGGFGRGGGYDTAAAGGGAGRGGGYDTAAAGGGAGRGGGYDTAAAGGGAGRGGGYDTAAAGGGAGRGGGYDSVAFGGSGDGYDAAAGGSIGGGYDTAAGSGAGRGGGYDSVAFGGNGGGYDTAGAGVGGGYDTAVPSRGEGNYAMATAGTGSSSGYDVVSGGGPTPRAGYDVVSSGPAGGEAPYDVAQLSDASNPYSLAAGGNAIDNPLFQPPSSR